MCTSLFLVLLCFQTGSPCLPHSDDNAVREYMCMKAYLVLSLILAFVCIGVHVHEGLPGTVLGSWLLFVLEYMCMKTYLVLSLILAFVCIGVHVHEGLPGIVLDLGFCLYWSTCA